MIERGLAPPRHLAPRALHPHHRNLHLGRLVRDADRYFRFAQDGGDRCRLVRQIEWLAGRVLQQQFPV